MQQQSTTTNWRRHSDALIGPDEHAQAVSSIDPPRILIVDSDIRSSTSLENMLHAAGYPETRVAYSGHAALAIAEEFEPSMALLELDLLDMSGYDVAWWLRGHARRQSLRLIALTSVPEHAGRELARRAGFERYLLKPVAALHLQRLLPAQQSSV
jgi:DNA-binding response OmpR family regulator